MTKKPTTQEIKLPKTINSLDEYKNIITKINNSNDLYLFRGQSNEKWLLCSSWIRQQTKDTKQDKKNELKKRLFKCIIIFEKYLKNDKKENKWLEELAYLQHTKDVETPLIDFTDDIMVATWFALAERRVNLNGKGKNAALFLLKAVKSNQIKNQIKDFNEKDCIYQSPNISNRAIAQRSYFLLDNQDWEQNDKISRITISSGAISKIFKYLVDKNKTHKSVFPDLKGRFLDNVSNSHNTYLFETLKNENTIKQNKFYTQEMNQNLEWVDDYYSRGNIYDLQGNSKKVIEDYTKVIETNHKSVEFYYNRGVSYAKQKQYEEAIKDFTKAIELNPKLWRTYYNQAFSYAKIGIHEKAINAYSKGIKLNPKFLQSYINRAISHEKLEQHTQAIRDYTQAIKLDPECLQAYLNRGVSYSEREQYNQAIKDFTKIIKINVKYSGAYNNRGNVYLAQRKYDQAIKDFTKAIELNTRLSIAYYNRGLAYSAQDNSKKAIEDWNDVLSLCKKEDELYKFTKAQINKWKYKTNS